MVLWGHPSTTGMRSIDYFISSEAFHLGQDEQFGVGTAQDQFTEQLIRLPSLGFSFRRPVLDSWLRHIDGLVIQGAISCTSSTETCARDYYASSLVQRPPELVAFLDSIAGGNHNTGLQKLINYKFVEGKTIILCPQHLPKFHPMLDEALKALLVSLPSALLVLVGPVGKLMWTNTLKKRWAGALGATVAAQQVLWLGALNQEEYTTMLLAGDLMLDPFPFGGGVTILEAFAVCTPVMTVPGLQVPIVPAPVLPLLAMISCILTPTVSVLPRLAFRCYGQHCCPVPQSVPALADGMIRSMGAAEPSNDLVKMSAKSIDELVTAALEIVQDGAAYRDIIAKTTEKLFDDNEASRDWGNFFSRAHRMLPDGQRRRDV